MPRTTWVNKTTEMLSKSPVIPHDHVHREHCGCGTKPTRITRAKKNQYWDHHHWNGCECEKAKAAAPPVDRSAKAAEILVKMATPSPTPTAATVSAAKETSLGSKSAFTDVTPAKRWKWSAPITIHPSPPPPPPPSPVVTPTQGNSHAMAPIPFMSSPASSRFDAKRQHQHNTQLFVSNEVQRLSADAKKVGNGVITTADITANYERHMLHVYKLASNWWTEDEVNTIGFFNWFPEFHPPAGMDIHKWIADDQASLRKLSPVLMGALLEWVETRLVPIMSMHGGFGFRRMNKHMRIQSVSDGPKYRNCRAAFAKVMQLGPVSDYKRILSPLLQGKPKDSHIETLGVTDRQLILNTIMVHAAERLSRQFGVTPRLTIEDMRSLMLIDTQAHAHWVDVISRLMYFPMTAEQFKVKESQITIATSKRISDRIMRSFETGLIGSSIADENVRLAAGRLFVSLIVLEGNHAFREYPGLAARML